MEQAVWPGHERTKDLVKDQSPGSAIGNPNVSPAIGTTMNPSATSP